jgi:hypothetical protein
MTPTLTPANGFAPRPANYRPSRVPPVTEPSRAAPCLARAGRRRSARARGARCAAARQGKGVRTRCGMAEAGEDGAQVRGIGLRAARIRLHARLLRAGRMREDLGKEARPLATILSATLVVRWCFVCWPWHRCAKCRVSGPRTSSGTAWKLSGPIEIIPSRPILASPSRISFRKKRCPPSPTRSVLLRIKTVITSNGCEDVL